MIEKKTKKEIKVKSRFYNGVSRKRSGIVNIVVFFVCESKRIEKIDERVNELILIRYENETGI